MLPTPFIQANTDGRLHPAAEASVSPLNRGFLYGDAIYEVWRTYDKVIFAWEEHWARLERSAAALYFPPLPAAATVLAEIRRTAAAYRDIMGSADELYIRLQLARGEGAIGLDPALADTVHFVILVQACPKLTAAQLEGGQTLSVAQKLRRNPVEALNPAWKTGNYLNNLLCLREAKLRGADEAVILNQAGEITEAAVCNLGFVCNGVIVTPPLSAGILAGVTRGLLLSDIAARAGVPTREATVRPEALGGMEEAFLLSTTKDLQPVGSIDGYLYKTGPHTVTRRLKSAFADYAREQAARWAADRTV
jgi:branched-chain amino acid aminotransferase